MIRRKNTLLVLNSKKITRVRFLKIFGEAKHIPAVVGDVCVGKVCSVASGIQGEERGKLFNSLVAFKVISAELPKSCNPACRLGKSVIFYGSGDEKGSRIVVRTAYDDLALNYCHLYENVTVFRISKHPGRLFDKRDNVYGISEGIKAPCPLF